MYISIWLSHIRNLRKTVTRAVIRRTAVQQSLTTLTVLTERLRQMVTMTTSK